VSSHTFEGIKDVLPVLNIHISLLSLIGRDITMARATVCCGLLALLAMAQLAASE
jgi:hypothetical protein